MPDLEQDALDAYEAALARERLLHEHWEELGRPVLTKGSMGQEVAHPLVGMMNAAARLSDDLRRPFMKRHRGPAPSAVISSLTEHRITRRKSASK